MPVSNNLAMRRELDIVQDIIPYFKCSSEIQRQMAYRIYLNTQRQLRYIVPDRALTKAWKQWRKVLEG